MTALRNGHRNRLLAVEVQESDPNRMEPKRCKHEGCYNPTRGSKDYCTDHVLNNTYAKHIIEEMANREQEDRQVHLSGSSTANIEGITAREILLELSQSGPRTIERMTRELCLSRPLIYNYALALKKSGMIQFYSTSRGSLVLCLMGQEVSGKEAAACA